ncbi:MAG: hypothetical protein K0R98_1219 [Rickettsiaceae bacterium]|jgi:hypothetical protein|nr:hypothetical protein [Rickettsiaceae bacterium]
MRNVVTTKQELDRLVAGNTLVPRDGMVILTSIFVTKELVQDKNYCNSLIVIGDNVRMYEARKKARQEHTPLNTIRHTGKGQAEIMDGYLRPNVFGIPTCDVKELGANKNLSDTEEAIKLKSYIDDAFKQLESYIKAGWNVIFLTNEQGKTTAGTGRATQEKGFFESIFRNSPKRQPESFKGGQISSYIDGKIMSLIEFSAPTQEIKTVTEKATPTSNFHTERLESKRASISEDKSFQ